MSNGLIFGTMITRNDLLFHIITDPDREYIKEYKVGDVMRAVDYILGNDSLVEEAEVFTEKRLKDYRGTVTLDMMVWEFVGWFFRCADELDDLLEGIK